MSKYTLLALLALLPLACRTSMGARKDAGPGAEAGTPDGSLDTPVTADASRPDSPFADVASNPGVPKAFRIENRTSRTVYLEKDSPLGCQRGSASGWQGCSFFHECFTLCSEVKEQQNCCLFCERSLELYAIAAGQSLTLPWDGSVRVMQTGRCAQCQCEQPTPASSGDFEVSASVFTDYQCMPSGCTTTSDGIIQMAEAMGPYFSIKVPFRVPSANDEVVITIAQIPLQDAGAPDAPAGSEQTDSKPVADTRADFTLADTTRDRGSAGALATLADVAGRTFQLSANDALPDASMDDRSCATSNPGAVYRLSFSDDGAKVSIERTDGPQETFFTGTVEVSSSSGLSYKLTPFVAGGASLRIRRDGDRLIGTLALLGSGVPVIWCIESPMRPL